MRGYKWLVHIISFVVMRQSFVTTPAQKNVEDFIMGFIVELWNY